MVTDIWIEDEFALILLLHIRDDGLMAEQVYLAERNGRDGEWWTPRPLSGGLLGFDSRNSSGAERILSGRPMMPVSESESLIHTGRSGAAEGSEPVRIMEFLIAEDVDVLEIEYLSRATGSTANVPLRREVGSPIVLLVLLPDDRVRVQPLRRDGLLTKPLGEPVELGHTVEPPRFLCLDAQA
jgi:hypothetical protein